ncbi:MAG TPA: hypothetical protein ENK44_07275 [Caldithrix abyssi]|uniref:Transposase DDE domain-containing protein n=1 Tax=Caldithrix abyssi TaxID=187145 RepID=A0A7V4U1C8_CALAY|nr:hypothetical protein [Caldithrix abyssi]
MTFIACTLMHAFRNQHLKGKSLAKARFDTIRLKLFKIGARVRYLRTKIKIRLSSGYAFKDGFRKIQQSYFCMSYPYLNQ